MSAKALIASLLAVGLLSGCAEITFLSQASKQTGALPTSTPNSPQSAENGEHYKVGNPYKISDVWYYPKADYEYVEEGVASWYGPKFHGKPTANGAIFDMNKVSAAHRTLPLPSLVRVTNLENGRSLKVKVNDRGPYSRGRIIDVSRRAAQLLGFEEKGTALVRVEILSEESQQLAALMQGDTTTIARGTEPPPPETAPAVQVAAETLAPPPNVAETANTSENGSVSAAQVSDIQRPEPDSLPTTTEVEQVAVSGNPQLFIQAGAFAEHVNAVRTQAVLKQLGPTTIEQYNRSDVPLFRVRVGPLVSIDNADAMLNAVVDAGYEDARLIVVE